MRKKLITVILIVTLFYFLIFFIWYKTSPKHKPSSIFFDMRKEGYQKDPLHDRLNVK